VYIRNFNEAYNNVKAQNIKKVMTELIRQHGLDELLKGLEGAYKEAVFARAKSSGPVAYRATILEIAVEQIAKTQEVVTS
jgi:hypothetical protein